MSSSGITNSDGIDDLNRISGPVGTQPTTVIGPENSLLPEADQRAAALTAAGPAAPETTSVNTPQMIGRYRVQRVLGDGGFGRVFLCRDEVLNRLVAVKVPHASRITRREDIQEYIAEAKILASFDHRSIVPVYDCGQSDDGLCFIVSKYIEGSDLAGRLKHTPPSFAASAELLARICDALHYAHQRHVVHRDVKPANILIDKEEQPWLTDFGIALKEEDYGRIQPTMGTLPYMSPEQLRGEGHLVDGRSDVFSTGVMMYVMLTGRRPFPGNRLSQDSASEPRPPRQLDDTIPKELERICLKALSPRVIDRYSTAMDMAQDLRDFLKAVNLGTERPASGSGISGLSAQSASDTKSATNHFAIVPKGLRSFDGDDAGFFLDLLPGARSRNGIPESVQFWIHRLSDFDPDRAFRVGLIYGPSGCGKSSFMKAGVIPRLPPEVIAVYMECTGLETEFRLLRLLRRQFPALTHDLTLVESLSAIRRGQLLAGGRKLVIMLDQFEQWLHAHPSFSGEELVRALRQCDGEHLQCVIGVRDDFWMAVSHFMDELEVPFVRGENVTAIDLFSVHHARKVLTAIGQAYQMLPQDSQQLLPHQKEFLFAAVRDLSQNDRIVPVHLALFAEMVKDQPWEITTLKKFGGIAGVGVKFLEETFNGRSASPAHRLHQQAARRVLKSLLPDGTTEIKGNMRSYDELQTLAGYLNSPKDFDALLHMLDAELRIITPADAEGLEASGIHSDQTSGTHQRYYHLAHDYLVPTLRDWLTRKQKETRRGRAELALTEYTTGWMARPTARSLPTLTDWVNIQLFVPRRQRSENSTAQSMMEAATRYYSRRLLLLLTISGITIWTFRNLSHHSHAATLVSSLKTSTVQDIPSIADQLTDYRHWANPMLLNLVHSEDQKDQLYASIALPPQLRNPEIVREGLLKTAPADFVTVRNALRAARDFPVTTEMLWKELKNVENDAVRRFRAGMALADFSPPGSATVSDEWDTVAVFLAEQLLIEIKFNPGSFDAWLSASGPLQSKLFTPLQTIFLNGSRSQEDRSESAVILSVLMRDQPEKLAELILSAEPYQYIRLATVLRAGGTKSQSALEIAYNQPLITDSERMEQQIASRRRKANAAITLLEFKQTSPLIAVLSSADDPDLTHYAEYRLSELSVHAEELRKLLPDANTPIRAALLRGLGGMSADQISGPLREQILEQAAQYFVDDKNTAVHSAAEWLLRSWGRKDLIAELQKKDSVPHKFSPDKDWYINSGGQTMAVFHGPITVQMGSPEGEADRDSDETQVTRTINRDFAIATTEVTVDEFIRLIPDYRHSDLLVNPTGDCPAVMMTWYRAAEYCYWLSLEEDIPPEQICFKYENERVIPETDYLQRTGYRLPTEAEWEYSCRSGSHFPYSFGNDTKIAHRFCWTAETSGGHNHTVGTLVPNRFGLFDMHGGTGEWMIEPYRETLIQSADTETSGTENSTEAFELNFEGVTRSGNAFTVVEKARSAARTPTHAYNGVGSGIGFRISRTLIGR